MKSYDFEYDGVLLSDKGLIICDFDSKDIETVSNGSEISFNTVSTFHGTKHELTSSSYEDCITATFQICKHPCDYKDGEISIDEVRHIMRWLNRKSFHKFRLLDAEYLNLYFEASFNVSKIEAYGKVYGFELEMFTNRPFALHEPVSMTFKNIARKSTKTIVSTSDEEGFIYPDMEIKIEESGNLEIYNALEDRTMRIANCVKGEVIKVSYPIIETSRAGHKLLDDFNWKFFRIATTFKNRENEITFSLPCTVDITYSPIVKVSI